MNVYLEAAKKLDRWKASEIAGCCIAVYEANGGGFRDLDFEQFFKPSDNSFGYWGIHWGVNNDERKACRVLALCFAAAMHETGDL